MPVAKISYRKGLRDPHTFHAPNLQTFFAFPIFQFFAPSYSGYPTKEVFESELSQTGFRVDRIEPTRPPWVAQIYYLLQKLP